MDNEIWKEIEDAPGYMISNFGRVKSSDKMVEYEDGRKRFFKGQLMAISLNPNGYHQVTLKVNRKTKTKFIHKLIAQYFIPNPNNLPCVNHIDGNKSNNMISNLEWCTYRDNAIHSYQVLKQKHSKACGKPFKMKAINNITGEIIIFPSVSQGARKLGYSKSHIFRVIKTKKQTSDGWVFSLIDVEDIEKVDND